MTLSPLRTASTPPANLSQVLARIGPLATFLASLSLIAGPPAAAQPVPRVPVTFTNAPAAQAAGICGTGASPYSLDLPYRPGGCVVPRTNRCPAFRLLIDHKTGQVTTRPLEAGHILLQLDEWERFQRTKPGGR
jgi:hypothetical protein